MTHDASDRLPDLTRWNRAGLTRFDYVDGDASVWLEELRIAMLGVYLRRKPAEQRRPEVWRNAFMALDPDDWPVLKDDLPAWARLKSDVPALPESRGERSDRLLRQYDTRGDGDHAWEINRAFARAAHVLLGHLDAYANEGYLRTATQWDNLRRLAAMVNYQPTPPASAITTVALLLYGDAGRAEIDRGLAMKHTPPEGGAPLIFETLEKLTAHPDLNAARVADWNVNDTEMTFGSGPGAVSWHADPAVGLSVGDLVILKGGTQSSAEAFTIADSRSGASEGQRSLTFDRAPSKNPSTGRWRSHADYRLLAEPQDVRIGARRSRAGHTVVNFDSGAGIVKGDILYVIVNGSPDYVEVLDAVGTKVTLAASFGTAETLQAEALAPYDGKGDGTFETRKGTYRVRYMTAGGVDSTTGSSVIEDGHVIAKSFSPENMTGEKVFAHAPDTPLIEGRIERPGVSVIPGRHVPVSRTVAFDGKPPKKLENGDWFVARDINSNDVKPLQVVGMQTASERFYIEFHAAPDGNPEDTEFHGPMTETLRAVGHDHNPEPAFTAGKGLLTGISTDARALLKPGRAMILSHTDGRSEQARLASATASGTNVEVVLEPLEAATGWAAGDMTIHFNCTTISHGETKGAQVLGSGDGERAAQTFAFTPKNISHIPSASTESGVIPDMDVLVEGETWEYRDLVDPTAEGTRAWSTILNEDGTLTIRFRRRLPTGQNNVTVQRHRVGTGIRGSGVPAHSFEKPMNKHQHVEKLLQPFETSGGADREAVSKLRSSTPQRLAANGRAVSLSDFEGLATRQASVLRAYAEHLPDASATQEIRLTLALEGGAPLTDTLRDTLRPAILARTVPGVRLTFAPYQPLLLDIQASVRVDLTAHDKTDMKLTCQEALQRHFDLNARAFGQAAYRSEVLATLETVLGVETAQVASFGLASPTPPPDSTSIQNGVIAAIFPAKQQIVHVGPAISGAIRVTVEDIR